MKIVINESLTEKELNMEKINIPREWDIKRIDEISNVVGGGTPSTNVESYWNGDICWIGPKEMSKVNGPYISMGERFITLEGAKKLKGKKILKDSVILSTRAPVGYVKIAKNDLYTNQGCHSIIANKNIDSFYIYYLLMKNKNLFEKFSTGSTFKELSGGNLKKIQFAIPKFEEQKRIAEVLSKQESIINKTKDLIEQLDKRNTFMQDELLSGRLRIKEEDGQVEFYKNPDDNWQTVLMNNIDYIIPLDWDILSLEHSDCSMGETILKSNILTDGEYPVYSATESDKIFGYINNPKKILEIGDLIISARGTIGYVKIAKQKCTSTQTTIQLKVNEITPIYLSTVLNNKRADFFPISGGAVPQITISQVKSIKISKPKQEKEIFNITNIIEKLNDEKEKYEELLIEEQKKFDFLLEELMSGRLRIEE